MLSQRYRNRIETLLSAADIRIAGNRPWDVHALNNRVYKRIPADSMLGVGEGYMDGWRECDQLDEMIARAFRADGNHLWRIVFSKDGVPGGYTADIIR